MNRRKTSILVTGGAGFIGSHIVDALVASGYEVIVVDDLSTGKKENIHPQARFYELDISDGKLKDVFHQEQPDYVCHHAAQMDVRKSVANPLFDANINILGSLNLLEQSVAYKIKKFLFASTGGAIYGEQDYFPADEAHPCRPLSPYGVAKLAVENYLFYYHASFGLSYTSLRYSNVYGPRQNPHGEAGVVAIFAEKMLKGKNPIIFGDGTQTRDFIYVDDVVSANLKALKSEYNGVINIGTGIEVSVNTLFDLLKNKACHNNIQKVYGQARQGEQLRSVIEYRRAQEILNWTPQVSLDDGLDEIIASLGED